MWWCSHKPNCVTNFACNIADCANRYDYSQMHFLVCTKHKAQNKETLDEFLKTLNSPPALKDLRLLFNSVNPSVFISKEKSSQLPPSIQKQANDGIEIIPDVENLGIFMLQNVRIEDKTLLVFFDSGCSGAGLSSRAHNLMGDNKC